MQQHILDSGHPLEGRSIGHVHDKSAPTVYGLRTSSPSGTCQWPSQLSRRLAFNKKTYLCHFDEQAKGTSLDHGLYAAMDLKFREDIAYMTFDGIDLHDQRLCNPLIRVPLRHETDHLPFACAQGIQKKQSWLRLAPVPMLSFKGSFMRWKHSPHSILSRHWFLQVMLVLNAGDFTLIFCEWSNGMHPA